MIRFGTDGWRARIGDGFTLHNVRRVAAGIAGYLKRALGRAAGTVAVGYDGRFLSAEAADEISRTLSASGLRVFLGRSMMPTPLLSFAVRQIGADLGVMVTASHNPPVWNGIKLKSSRGASLDPATVQAIEEAINGPAGDAVPPAPPPPARVLPLDPLEAYQAHVAERIDLAAIARWGGKVAVDAMYGSAQGLLARLLAPTGVAVEEIRNRYNPGFDRVPPEPIARNLEPLRDALRRGAADIGLAFDGDGDRLGVIDERGCYLTSHEVFAALLTYLVQHKGLRGTVVKTVSVTAMIDRICAAHGLPLVVTPVGFKHIAARMEWTDVLMGGEESGGFGFRGHVPDRDGLFTALLVLEMMARSGVPLSEQVDRLQQTYGPHRYRREDVPLARPVTLGAAEAKEAIRMASARYGAQRGETLDGIKLWFGEEWLLLRPSGTEPLVRLYAEAAADDRVDRYLAMGRDLLTRLWPDAVSQRTR